MNQQVFRRAVQALTVFDYLTFDLPSSSSGQEDLHPCRQLHSPEGRHPCRQYLWPFVASINIFESRFLLFLRHTSSVEFETSKRAIHALCISHIDLTLWPSKWSPSQPRQDFATRIRVSALACEDQRYVLNSIQIRNYWIGARVHSSAHRSYLLAQYSWRLDS